MVGFAKIRSNAIKINVSGIPYRVDSALAKMLEDAIGKSEVSTDSAVTLNFCDPGYSAANGGFHPVEIRVSQKGAIEFITDFAYDSSGPFAELVKEIDFDFACGVFGHFGRDFPIAAGRELFGIWQQNFLSYFDMGVYQVEVQCDG